MSDLTDAELAAQEGAFDDPSAEAPLLSDDVLGMAPVVFLQYLVSGAVAEETFSESIGSYLDHRRQLADAAQAVIDAAGEEPRLGPIDSRLIDPATRELE